MGHKVVVFVRRKHWLLAIASAERGVNTTCVCCMSAAGQYIPPMILYKRMRMKDELKDGAPPGSLVLCNTSGWMEQDTFLAWLNHFIASVKPTQDMPVLLILDGHWSHTRNLDAINLASDSGVIMLSLPPHTTHRLQPLGVTFFRPLSIYYNQATDRWLRHHPWASCSEMPTLKPRWWQTQSTDLRNVVFGHATWTCSKTTNSHHLSWIRGWSRISTHHMMTVRYQPLTDSLLPYFRSVRSTISQLEKAYP